LSKVLSITLIFLACLILPGQAASLINLRIEGANHTIFEALLEDVPLNVTTASGGTHPCNGLNDGANPTPGPTCTSALAIAADLAHFTFDGTFDPEFDDFFITRIAGSEETSTEFWGLLLNFQFTPVGGCQQEVTNGDDVLWAFNAFNAVHFLKLQGPNVAHVSEPITVTVTDGMTGEAVEGATVHGQTTDADGNARIVFHEPGAVSLKATAPSSIRSNAVIVLVE